jgi:hypothetical protein
MKDAGLILRFPNGRRKAGETLPGKRTILLGRARRSVITLTRVLKWPSCRADTRKCSKLNQPEKLSYNSDRGLDRIRDILEMKADPDRRAPSNRGLGLMRRHNSPAVLP